MADISKIKTLDGQTHNIKDSTARSTANSKSTVVANPTLAGTEAELSGLQIDGTKFKLGGGGNIQVLTSAQYAALSQQEKMADIIYVITDDENTVEYATKAELMAKQDALVFDDTPTQNSVNPVKSGGVYAALATKQNALTFDSAPTAGSSNPVTSDGIKAANDALKAVAFTKTLSSGSWSSSVQTVSDTRFIVSGYSYIVRPVGSNSAAYNEAQIYADDVTTAGQMTFHCVTTPSANLTVNILRVVSV